jgi:hypothetical protein
MQNSKNLKEQPRFCDHRKVKQAYSKKHSITPPMQKVKITQISPALEKLHTKPEPLSVDSVFLQSHL